nr:hypothetical protein [Streptomyces fulvoviolaceus]
MHTSPSRQSSEDEEGSDGEGVADDVSVLDVLVLSVAEGEGVVSVAVSVASDTVEAACDSAEDVTVFSGAVTLFCWIAWVVGVACGVAADCSCGAFVVEERVADEVRLERCVSVGVDEAGVGSVAGISAIPMASLSGAEAAWVRSVDWRSSAETVRPPPTRATAVATSALRWVFFQRSRWRRRAARPRGAGDGASVPSYGCSCGASLNSSAPESPSCHR